MGKKFTLRGPNGKDYEIGEGQALAVMDAPEGKDPELKVVEKRESKGATWEPADEYLQAFQRHCDLIEKQTATQEQMIASLKEVQAIGARANRVTDPATAAWMDSEDTKSVAELIEEVPTSDWAREVHRLNDSVYLEHEQRCAIAAKKRRQAPDIRTTRHFAKLQKVVRAATWTPGGSGAGAEYIPLGVSRSLINLHRIQTDIISAFPRVEMPQGVGQLNIPVMISGATVRVGLAASGTTPFAPQGSTTIHNPGTGILTLVAVKHESDPVAYAIEEQEDATIAVGQALSSEAIAAMGKAWESGVLNGQGAAEAGLDAANGPAPANGYSVGGNVVSSGLRRYGIVTNANTVDAAGRVDLADFEAAWSALGPHGIPDGSNNVIAILSWSAWFDLVTDSVVRPLAGGGGLGSLPNGALTRLYGIPIYVTDQFPTNLAAAGTASTPGTTTCALLVNVNRWRVGMKRAIELKVQEAPLSDAVQMRCYARHCIGHAPPETDDHVSVLRNVAL